MRETYRLAAAVLIAAAAACQRSSDAAPVRLPNADSVRAAEARRDSVVRARPGYVIDSVFSVDEELRRFRAGIGRAPRQLEGGATSRRVLVSRFAAALQRRDTAALLRLTIDRAEFAYLIYPGSANTRPPYRQSPEIAWMMLAASSAKGLERLVERYGGASFPVTQDLHCDPSPRRDAGVTYWTGCRIPVADATGRTVSRRLFGSIAERDGRVKFLSYANEL